jgi:lipopolysaccharide transport system ATP-binding protein
MNEIIKVQNLGKLYRLGTLHNSSFGQLLNHAARRAGNLLAGRWKPHKHTAQTLWALRNVNFSVQPGEVVGLVGRNGNGKSTLLKILSRITLPTEGTLELNGSLASLLEVGTGFHPELTGRENVFLNGAILGMNRSTVRKKMDEIIEFSEIGDYLDTPVKRYSSGMYVRLAFAVAAHLESDILVIDEVLAVGDGAFQKKCLGKIQSFGGTKRTVFFVSHSLPAVRSICSRAILLNQGQIAKDGPTEAVLAEYNRLLQTPRDISNESLNSRLLLANGAVRFHSVSCQGLDGRETWSFQQGQTVRLVLDWQAHQAVPSLATYVVLTSMVSGEVITSQKQILSVGNVPSGTRSKIEITFPEIPLMAGEYGITVCLGDKTFDRRYDYLDYSQSIPWLSIRAEGREQLELGGYFSIPVKIAS